MVLDVIAGFYFELSWYCCFPLSRWYSKTSLASNSTDKVYKQTLILSFYRFNVLTSYRLKKPKYSEVFFGLFKY